MRAARRQLPLVLLHLVAQAAFGLLLARAYLARENTLERAGHWVATKTTLERGVMGAFYFMRGGQSVARSRLNLSAWFGYQEVLYKRPLRLRDVEFDFQLGPKAYLCFIYAKTDSGFSGVRVSLSERFPSQFFTASDDGEFQSREPIEIPPLRARAWHRARLSFSENELSLAIEGKPAGRVRTAVPREQVVGFRGGRRTALVDNIAFRQETGDPLRPASTVHESFGPADFRRVGGLAVLALLLLNGLALRLGRRGARKKLALATLLANGVGAVLASLLLAYQSFVASRYPALDRALLASEEQWKIATAEEVRAEMRRRLGGGHESTRILFLGTSQTWGAGAAKRGQTFVEVVQRKLAETDRLAGFECLNGGISAVDSSYLADVLESEWVRLGAKAVVIDLGNNDSDPERLGRNLVRMIRLARANGAEPLIVLEPNSAEDPGADLDALSLRHAAMRQAAATEAAVVIDMHDHLARNEDRGFLWWDSVHLTSFGQRLFAERLLPELTALLRRRPSGG